MALPLEGKVAVVTGSSRGIGKVVALQLAADGASVAVCARTEQERDDGLPGTIGETMSLIEQMGRPTIAIRMDVGNDEDLRSTIDRVMREWGRIDILVNNAALVPQGPYLASDVDQLDAAMRINVHAPYLLTLLAAEKMAAAGGGVVVNMSSGASRHPQPPSEAPAGGGRGGTGAIYGMTKAALDRFASGIAGELFAKNIAVININPGFTVTERFLRNRPDADTSNMERPETTAKAISFLCQNPMAYSGRMLNAREIVEQNAL